MPGVCPGGGELKFRFDRRINSQAVDTPIVHYLSLFVEKSYRSPSDLELKLRKLILLIDILSLFVEKSHRSPSDLESKLWKLALLIDVFDRKTRSHSDLSDTNQT